MKIAIGTTIQTSGMTATKKAGKFRVMLNAKVGRRSFAFPVSPWISNKHNALGNKLRFAFRFAL